MTVISPDAENLLLGAGQVFFDRFDSNGASQGFRHLGNCETFEITTEDDLLDKNESMTRARALYKRVTRKRTTTIRIAADEFSLFNMALGLMGQENTHAAQVATPVVGESLDDETIQYAVYKTAKLGPITAVAVKFNAVAGTLGVDYEILDANLGLIKILKVSSADPVTIDYTPTAYASGWNEIRGGTESSINGALMFVGDPATGPKYMVEVWRVTITPDGAVGLISEEWGQFGLIAAVESDITNHPNEPLYKVTELPY